VFAVEQQSRSLFKIETNVQEKKKKKKTQNGSKKRKKRGERIGGKKITAEHCRCISSGGNGGERIVFLSLHYGGDKHSCYIPNTRSKNHCEVGGTPTKQHDKTRPFFFFQLFLKKKKKII
jgi:hypothetical protein